MKKLLCLFCIISLFLALTGCIETKTLHCDHCGTEITVKADNNAEEDWILYCDPCYDELFSDDPILGNN